MASLAVPYLPSVNGCVCDFGRRYVVQRKSARGAAEALVVRGAPVVGEKSPFHSLTIVGVIAF